VDELKQRLATIIVAALRSDRKADELEGRNLVDFLGISSIDALEILISVEIAYDFEIPDEDLDVRLVSSLDELDDYVRRRLAERG
jgi:acyl carrier protein